MTIEQIVTNEVKKFKRELIDKLKAYDKKAIISEEQAERKLIEKQQLREAIENAYQKYPRKEGKSDGIRKLMRGAYRISLDDIPALEQSITAYAEEVSGREKKYIKQFSSFVTGWKDWLDKPVAKRMEW